MARANRFIPPTLVVGHCAGRRLEGHRFWIWVSLARLDDARSRGELSSLVRRSHSQIWNGSKGPVGYFIASRDQISYRARVRFLSSVLIALVVSCAGATDDGAESDTSDSEESSGDSSDGSSDDGADECCKVCTTGRACGDSCIQATKTCHVGPGCACDG